MTWKLFAITTPLSYEHSIEIQESEADVVHEVFGKLGYSVLRDTAQQSLYVSPPNYSVQVPVRQTESVPVESTPKLLKGLHPRRAGARRPARRRSAEEVQHAIDSLTPGQYCKLHAVATQFDWLLKLCGKVPWDLVNEVLERTLNGRRGWSPTNNFYSHCELTMQSIASSWKKQLLREGCASFEQLDLDVVDPQEAMESSVEQNELYQHLEQKLQKRGADLSAKILDLIRCGYEPCEIMDTLRISRKVYDSQVLRLRRHAQTLQSKGNE